jgi:DNA-binding Xre family transcriptional regulator
MQVISMISYKPFWDTLKASAESTYSLINKHHISSSTIDKLRKNKPLNTTTINDLCRILGCAVEHIMMYVPSDSDQIL